ncbi:HAD superfamily hydrolase [Chlamydiales bacterium STE3]|nr:HAD superfamily hydrolase [Chlamydiales bacterium STE3]
MKKIKALFLDIGGVLMTNGWDHTMRHEAIKKFHLDQEDFESRHREWNPALETDRISLEEYLNKTVFWTTRSFTMQQFKDMMFSFSKPYSDMLHLFQRIKENTPIDIAFVSNEGRELAMHRIVLADLKNLSEYFFISAFVHIQKPDLAIYRLSLDVMQLHPEEVFYIDDRTNMVESAAAVGIDGLVHESLAKTEQKLLEIL